MCFQQPVWVVGALGHLAAVRGSVLHPKKAGAMLVKTACSYAFLCPSEQFEGGICGLNGVPSSAVIVVVKTNSCYLAAVPLLHKAETIQSSASPLLSSLETLQPLDQVFFLQELFPRGLQKLHKIVSVSSDFGWKRRNWILHLQ